MNRHGLLLINKPSGITSHDVVARVRRALSTREVGHAGTLDPLASGLLVLLLGEGTKISDYILTGDKGYTLGVRLGIETDTFDISGQILNQQDVQLDPELIISEARKLTGDFEWPVPIYSAIKKDGQKLYDYARRSEPVELPIKKMSFWDFSPIEATSNTLLAQIRCTKGSYIRTWAVELGKRLGVPAVIEKLHRTYSAPYISENALELSDIETDDGMNSPAFASAFVTLKDALPNFLTVTVKGKDEKLMLSGQISYDLERRLICEQKEANRRSVPIGIKVLSGPTGQILSILEINPCQKLKVKRVFKGLDA